MTETFEIERTGTRAGYAALFSAIIKQAAFDYAEAKKRVKKNPRNVDALDTIAEVEDFFYCGWFREVCDIDPDYIMQLINHRYVKNKTRKYCRL